MQLQTRSPRFEPPPCIVPESPEGEAAGVLLQELMDSVDAKSLQLRELRHRMRNNFQVVLSMIRLEKSRPLGSEALAELRDMENRITALNGVDGELLLESEDQPVALADYIRQLAGRLEALFRHDFRPVSFLLTLEAMEAPAKTAAHLGLLINEAITNSFKHAVPRGATEIALSLAKQDGGLVLTISDNGPGLEDADPQHVGGTGLMRAFARGTAGDPGNRRRMRRNAICGQGAVGAAAPRGHPV